MGRRPLHLAWLLLWLRLFSAEEVLSDQDDDDDDQPRACPALRDSNGRWEGSRLVGGRYTLRCAPGFQVTRHDGYRSATITCPENLQWSEELKCEDVDNCDQLKHGCGAKGICIDLVDGYDCNCEKGYPRRKSKDGEIVCGDEDDKKICGGATCGSYGLCIDLKGDFPEDKEEKATEKKHARRRFRCECADGFSDNGTTCVRKDCGALSDKLGSWNGSTLFNEEYTLECGKDSFVWGYRGLRDITIRCSARGAWLSHPVCHSPAQEARDARWEEARFWMSLGCVFLCIGSAAMAAGLTLGLATLEPFGLSVTLATSPEHCKAKEEKEKLLQDQVNARLILPLVQDHHRLLVTLMLFNTVANESLPIFLDELVPSWAAVLVSVTAVLICGEILPSAIFTGPSQMRIAGACVPLVQFLQWLFFYISKPIIKVLDHIIEHEEDQECVKYSRAELRALLQLHGQKAGDAEEKDSNAPASNHGEPHGAVTGTAEVDTGSHGTSGPLACLLSSMGPGEEDGHEEGGHSEGPSILSATELQLINGSFDLQEVPLDKVAYTRRRQCMLGDREELASELLLSVGVGTRAVLLLNSEAAALEEPAQRCPLVTASDVCGCLRLKDVVSGGRQSLKHLAEPLVLVPDWATALEALRYLGGGKVGVVVHGMEDEATVQGVVSSAQIMATMLKVRSRPNLEHTAPEGEGSDGGPIVPTATRRHVGHRPLFKSSTQHGLERNTSGAGILIRSQSRSATTSIEGLVRSQVQRDTNRRVSA